MREIIRDIFMYLKNPVLKTDSNTTLKYRFNVFFKILLISIISVLIITPMFVVFEELQWIHADNHKVEELFKNMTKWQIFIFAVILAPIIEELIFRGCIPFFKDPTAFKMVFYTSTLLFGFIHITNFEITKNVLILSPFLVLPQIILGGYFGYIRIKFGLQWSILLHSTYNGILFLLSFLPES